MPSGPIQSIDSQRYIRCKMETIVNRNLINERIEFPLKSISSEYPVDSVHFVNLTRRTVDIFWLNFQGSKVLYYKLPPRYFARINTFKTHPWLCYDAQSSAFLHMNGICSMIFFSVIILFF